jgi:drug/metabolite transporter (DMT)-like permease
MANARPALPVSGIVSLVLTYLVWGSTYLAIRVAVREGAGWGPFWLGATRVLLAAALLFAFNRLRGVPLRPARHEVVTLAVTGLLLWIGGNGAVNWAEQRIDSGLAALIVGTMPIWVALMESAIDRRPPSSLLMVSLLTGFGGLVVLTYPLLQDGIEADLVGVAAVVFAAISWGFGSIIIHRRPVALDSLAASGWQQLFGGMGFVAVALLVAEPRPAPTAEAWAAWGYLVVFGSLVAYTAFLHALKVLPTTVVMTYAYVNPAVAVLLGWLILSEPVTVSTVMGMVLILIGVYGVFNDKAKRSAS